MNALGKLNGRSASNEDTLPVAVDAMGSDLGASALVEGCVQAYKEFGAKSILVGPEEELSDIAKGFGAGDLPIGFKQASEVITMSDSPARSIRRKPDSSLCVAYNLLNDGKVSAMLSAGNSGAMMAAGRVVCGLVPGIERPAIATIIPRAGDRQPNVILDTGANVDCNAQNLVQFAVMGGIYYSSLFEKEAPRVGLLSNGTESSKGTDVIRAAAASLSQLEAVNYIGYVEGRDATGDKADVIVCDGFVGNVLLKVSEGCVRLIYQQLMFQARSGIMRQLGLRLIKGALKEVFADKFDYSAWGGAPLLGLNKLAFVLHGASEPRAVKNAVRLATAFSNSGMTEKITKELTRLDERFAATSDQELFSTMFSGSPSLVPPKNKNKKARVNSKEEKVVESPKEETS